MANPSSFTFYPLEMQNITWSLSDTAGTPISNAVVRATMYSNRDPFQPDVYPGTADSIINALTLAETTTPGTYQVSVPMTFNPAPALSGFTTVITAADQLSAPLGTFNVPTIVTPPQDTIDLVTVEQVKNWLGIGPDMIGCNAVIQLLISSFSQYVLNRTGRSSFKHVVQFSQTYDGNGNNRLFLDETPIVNIVSVNIGSYSVPLSSGVTTPGLYIDRSKKSIVFRNSGFSLTPPLSIYPYRFIPGEGNVQVTYTAGYSAVPFDLQEITIEIVAQNYKRKDWIDLASKALSTPGASGTTSYRAWAITPFAEQVIRFYTRYARPS